MIDTREHHKHNDVDLVEALRALAEAISSHGVRVIVFPELLDDAADAIEELRLLEESDGNELQLAYEEIRSLHDQIVMLRSTVSALEAEVSRLTHQ